MEHVGDWLDDNALSLAPYQRFTSPFPYQSFPSSPAKETTSLGSLSQHLLLGNPN